MKDVITTILVDFGGVIAEEGFRDGLRTIGKRNGFDPDFFFQTAESIIFETGYVVGMAGEGDFWSAVRSNTGITEEDAVLRREILSRFLIRPEMISLVDRLRREGVIVAILSDQTNWLDEIDKESGLFRHFDRVFNSYHIHKSKRDKTVFSDVCAQLGERPANTLFIDDTAAHVARARDRGLRTIHFRDMKSFQDELAAWLP